MGCISCEKPNVKYKKGLWSPDEDERLRDYVLRHGLSCWSAVPAKAGLQRNGKSCRLRWINYLRPGLKRGNFSREEEEVVVKLQAKLGNKWSQIAIQLPGRTDNEVKNYWNSYLKKKIIKPQKHDQTTPTSSITSSSSGSSLQEQLKREEPSIAKEGEIGAVNCCNLPRVLFGDSLDDFNGGDQGLFNLDEVMSTSTALHGTSLGSSKLELVDQDCGGGFIDGFDEMYEGIINETQQEPMGQLAPESSALFDIFPWCDDL